MEIIKITPTIDEVSNYFKNQKSEKFRYFNNRGFEAIYKHKYTKLYFIEKKCVGYGHIDPENGFNWLGIFVTDTFRGIGVGEFIMNDIIINFDETLTLSVDLDNHVAISLYKKIGFLEFEKKDQKLIMVYKNE
jgi:ribosomal protein S18 acetylase RimI-like enzyme